MNPNTRMLFSWTPLLCVVLLLANGVASSRVKTGADVLVERRLDLLKGKRVGLITNQTGCISSGEYLVDVLIARGIHVVALFSAEHGIRGEAAAGEPVADGIDRESGIHTFSLFGATTKPTPEMLRNVDLLVFDIQDVGARFYTYISTMTLCMEAAAEAGIPCLVLDRPNPIGMMPVDGPVLEDSLRSFVGMVPVPVVYGLSSGELARMINGKGWLKRAVHADLTVIPLEGWKRGMRWEETGLRWIPPSPNIPTPEAAFIYPGTYLLEATNLSEGRGTPRPFNTIGAPFIDGDSFCRSLSRLNLKGVRFAPTTFTPTSSKFKGELCGGVAIEVTDPVNARPTTIGLHILVELRRSYPAQVKFTRSWLEKLVGDAKIYSRLTGNWSVAEIAQSWVAEEQNFHTASAAFRMY